MSEGAGVAGSMTCVGAGRLSRSCRLGCQRQYVTLILMCGNLMLANAWEVAGS